MDRSHLGKVCATGVGFALAFLATKLFQKSKTPSRISEHSENTSEQREQEKLNSKELQKLADLQELLAHKSQ